MPSLYSALVTPFDVSNDDHHVQPALGFAGRRIIVLGRNSPNTAPLCQMLMAQGARLAVVDTVVDRAADFMASAEAGQAVALSGDMSDEKAILAAISRANDFMGGIDGLCYFGSNSLAQTPTRMASLGLVLDIMAQTAQANSPKPSALIMRETEEDLPELLSLLSALSKRHGAEVLRVNAISLRQTGRVRPADFLSCARFLLCAQSDAVWDQLLRIGPA